MTKAEFIAQIKEKADLPSKAKAEAALDAALETITACLAAGDSLTLTGFGSFKTAKRAARSGRNPRTGKKIKIAASTVAKFTPGKKLKEAVNPGKKK